MSERKKKVKADSQLTVVRRCELLDVARSTAYYEAAAVSDDDLLAMRLIDERSICDYRFMGVVVLETSWKSRATG